MITLRQLRYLDALARHRHFGRAAEACAVTQPALSMQIRDLEQELGVQLVERRAGEAVLTSIGAEVVHRGEQLLSGARDLVDLARHHGRVLSGRLKLGIIPTIAPYLLPKLLPVLQPQYPDMILELRETQTKTLLEELVRGDLDAAVMALPVPNPELETMRLFEDAFLLAVPSDDPLPERARVTPDQIDRDRLILLEEGHCLRDQALDYCGMPRSDTPVRLGATSLTTVMQMVANGYGVTLVPEIAIDAELRDERVKLLRFKAPEPSRTIGLVYRKTSPRKADFTALAQTMAESLGQRTRRQRGPPHPSTSSG